MSVVSSIAVRRCILSLISCFLFACGNEPSSTVTDRFESLESSEEIEELLLDEVGRLSQWVLKKRRELDSTHSYIFENVLVKDLYINSIRHLPYTKKIVANEALNFEVKKLLIRFSQCLNLDDYLSLGRLVYTTGDEDLMTVLISPGPEYGVKLDENYSDPEVIEFLDLVLYKYPVLVESIELIRSGSNFRQTIEYRKAGEQQPVLTCF
ncbi:hypothetical protein NBRC116583_00830 [Arenicella sp. 4NH20-0111]